ncbi:hypothetical protein OHD16_22575 [Sphingobacterium sp. ML3W]|uniref:hypothetical protein n=1 Tax=Sphingobacterium sp. ML3W TaxID=1538644 RepID=UPI00249C54B9|nr:hypothetical protein [Sphingobacterium sp. ML3W]WFA77507.1 hypothetical protein OGI71_15715 [Sphingobacterium sp. ML3W]
MKTIVNKINRALQMILMAPVKLPGKVLAVVRYVALGLGIMETVLEKDNAETEDSTDELEKGGPDAAK